VSRRLDRWRVPARGVAVAALRCGLMLALLGAAGGAALAQSTANAREARLRTLLDAAHAQVGATLRYDPAYVRLPYPGGDVPLDRGVCSDVVIRAYRALDIDLQQRVHEDMRAHFSVYPALWGLRRPDRNIDHRRVPNLEVFFTRHGRRLSVSADPADYRPGDLVTWRLPGNLPHIGIVTARRDGAGSLSPLPLAPRPWIVHNVGAGAQVEDVLFAWPITGHFRYLPEDPAP
jgi:uncharacterized protein